MPERLEDECGIPHIVSDAVPQDTLYDLFIVLCTHATNMQVFMADPKFLPYLKSLQAIHEDLIWSIGILEIAYGLTPGEVIEYSNKREGEGAFRSGPKKGEGAPQGKSMDEYHERMFG